MFTHVDVRPVRPEYITHRIAKEVDLLSIRLHDLRHQAATLALAGAACTDSLRQRGLVMMALSGILGRGPWSRRRGV